MPFHDSFILLVRCMTYNQHEYIEDAMNGFVMQQTDFPYLCIVMDDCSTDGEQDTIKNYFQEHFTQLNEKETDNYIFHLGKHKTNEKCYFAVYFLKYNHYSIKKSKDSYYTEWLDKCKYIAMCEGDDYWTDENKLQIQVDFLEKHPEYSASFHNVNIFQEKEKKLVSNYIFREVPDILDAKELAKKFCIPTCSFIYRNNPIINTKLQKLGQMPFGDYSLELFNAEKGKIKKFLDIMGVYRVGYGINTSTFNNPYANFKRYLQDYMAMAKLYMALEDSDTPIATYPSSLYKKNTQIENLYIYDE